MKYLNEYHKQAVERKLAKQKLWHEQFMKLPLEQRKKWAEEQAQLMKERLAEANRLYPE